MAQVNGTNELYGLNASGGEPYPVATGLPMEPDAVLSPDGSRIAFSMNDGENTDIFVVNIDGSGLMRLTEDPARDEQPAWSPDSSWIAFASFRDGNYNIYQVSAWGGEATPLTNSSDGDMRPVYSRDGAWVIFTSARDGNYAALYRVPSAGGETEMLPGQDGALAHTNPVFSPDGYWMALEQRQGETSNIILLNPETGEQIEVTTSQVDDVAPAWSPDGSRLAFCSQVGGLNWEVFVYDFSVGSLVNLSNSPANECSPAWSPDGRHLAWTSDVDGNAEIYTAAVTGEGLIRLTYTDWANETRLLWH